MKTQIKVTQHDIEIGIHQSAFYCPVAWAINRAMNTRENARVYQKSWRLSCRDKARRLPREAIAFIASFDKGIAVKPITFKMSLPHNATT